MCRSNIDCKEKGKSGKNEMCILVDIKRSHKEIINRIFANSLPSLDE